MTSKTFFTILLSAALFSCNGQQVNSADYTQAAPMHIHRLDKELFQLIDQGDSTLQAQLKAEYKAMLDILGKGVLNVQSSDAPGFFDKLANYYSEPTLKGLYRDAVVHYDAIGDIEQALGSSFAYLRDNFPSMQTPAVYMHVSGLNQNVLTGDSLLSLSIDKYMGDNYPLYQDFFYDYQKQRMQRSHVVPDYLTGWLMSEFPFAGKENVLLEWMVYEGKIKHLVGQAMPESTEAGLMGYSEAEYNWCKENEAEIWKAIVERKHLYTPDQMTTAKYFENAPSTFLTNEAPGDLGKWIGWQIVKQYVKATNASPGQLMQNANAQEILTAAKYKP